MGWRFTEDVEEYAAAAGRLLAASPAEHTVSLTVVEDARARPPCAPAPAGEHPETYGWWTDATGAVAGAVSRTPPYALLLAVVPDEAMRPLAAELLARGLRPPGVNAATQLAVAFASVWKALTGERAVLGHALRLYRLGTLVPPDPAPPGRARPATDADTGLLAEWLRRFGEDTGVPVHGIPELLRERLGHGGLTLWEDERRVPLSLASGTRPAAGVVRIGPVYTPPALRRRGLGAAVTAAATRAAQERGGREVVLFTDLANPTSNALYQRLGYRPVTDRALLHFEAGR